jgi:hypothetical protein
MIKQAGRVGFGSSLIKAFNSDEFLLIILLRLTKGLVQRLQLVMVYVLLRGATQQQKHLAE